MKCLVLFLCILLLLSAMMPLTVMADTGETGTDTAVSTDRAVSNRSVLFFLFSEDEIRESCDVPVIALFSDIKISAGVNANIYSFFSTITVLEAASYKKLYTMSSIVNTEYAENQPDAIPMLRVFASSERTEGRAVYRDEIPAIVIALFVVLLQFGLVLLFYLIKKGFIEQGAAAIPRGPEKILRNGLIGYLSVLLIVVLFAISVAFLPVSLVLFLFAAVTALVGEASFALFIGHRVLPGYKERVDPLVYIALGDILIALVRIIPVVGWYINVIAMPIVCVGIVVTNVINGYFKKVYFEVN